MSSTGLLKIIRLKKFNNPLYNLIWLVLWIFDYKYYLLGTSRHLVEMATPFL